MHKEAGNHDMYSLLTACFVSVIFDVNLTCSTYSVVSIKRTGCNKLAGWRKKFF